MSGLGGPEQEKEVLRRTGFIEGARQTVFGSGTSPRLELMRSRCTSNNFVLSKTAPLATCHRALANFRMSATRAYCLLPSRATFFEYQARAMPSRWMRRSVARYRKTRATPGPRFVMRSRPLSFPELFSLRLRPSALT